MTYLFCDDRWRHIAESLCISNRSVLWRNATIPSGYPILCMWVVQAWVSHRCCPFACSTCPTCSTSTSPGERSCQTDGTASSSLLPWRPPKECCQQRHRRGLRPWNYTSWPEIVGLLQSTWTWGRRDEGVSNCKIHVCSFTYCTHTHRHTQTQV